LSRRRISQKTSKDETSVAHCRRAAGWLELAPRLAATSLLRTGMRQPPLSTRGGQRAAAAKRYRRHSRDCRFLAGTGHWLVAAMSGHGRSSHGSSMQAIHARPASSQDCAGCKSDVRPPDRIVSPQRLLGQSVIRRNMLLVRSVGGDRFLSAGTDGRSCRRRQRPKAILYMFHRIR